MSTTTQTQSQSKKRKQAAAPGPSNATPSKKSKKDKKDKGKGKSKASSGGEFRVIKASLVVSIPPVFASNPRAGVEELLDSMLMRYIPAFEGVVLAHSDLVFMDKKAVIKADCPYSVCDVAFDATVWSPRIGMKLVGQVNLCSPDHIALLIHRTFNVSIPRHHILTDNYEFEYGAAENDPEFGVGEENAKQAEAEDEEGGKWIHSITGEKLGGPDGFLEFTVIGFTIANEMLSLRGSLHDDPFSPLHVPAPPKASSERAASESSTAVVRAYVEEEEEEESEVDTFEKLGRMGDEAQAEEKRRLEVEQKEKEQEKEKRKRKRKDKSGEGEGMDIDGAEVKKKKVKSEKHKRKKSTDA